MIGKYIKKPVEIEAVLWDGSKESFQAVIEFLGYTVKPASDYFLKQYEEVTKEGLKISTLEGTMNASIGDYIIKGVQGECYPCKPDIFHLTYSAVPALLEKFWYIIADIDDYNVVAKIPTKIVEDFEDQLVELINEEYLFEWYNRGSLINEWATYSLTFSERLQEDSHYAVFEDLQEAALEKGYVELHLALVELL